MHTMDMTVGGGGLRKHEGFNIHRQGLDMDMVSTRHQMFEPDSESHWCVIVIDMVEPEDILDEGKN